MKPTRMVINISTTLYCAKIKAELIAIVAITMMMIATNKFSV